MDGIQRMGSSHQTFNFPNLSPAFNSSSLFVQPSALYFHLNVSCSFSKINPSSEKAVPFTEYLKHKPMLHSWTPLSLTPRIHAKLLLCPVFNIHPELNCVSALLPSTLHALASSLSRSSARACWPVFLLPSLPYSSLLSTEDPEWYSYSSAQKPSVTQTPSKSPSLQ